MKLRTRNSLVQGILIVLFSIPAQATPLYTLVFNGNCTDCAAAAGTEAHAVTVTLVLQNYEIGSAFARDNFYSFTYEGSNLVNDFTVDQSQWLSGTRQKLRGEPDDTFGLGDPLDFSLRLNVKGAELWSCTELGYAAAAKDSACQNTQKLAFEMGFLGDWAFGDPAKDVGDLNGTDGPPPGGPESPGITGFDDQVNGVPEPSSLMLAGLGVAALRSSFRSRR